MPARPESALPKPDSQTPQRKFHLALPHALSITLRTNRPITQSCTYVPSPRTWVRSWRWCGGGAAGRGSRRPARIAASSAGRILSHGRRCRIREGSQSAYFGFELDLDGPVLLEQVRALLVRDTLEQHCFSTSPPGTVGQYRGQEYVKTRPPETTHAAVLISLGRCWRLLYTEIRWKCNTIYSRLFGYILTSDGKSHHGWGWTLSTRPM